MGKGAILRWIENKMLARHLHGCGVEIGALGRPFPVRSGVHVWHVDRCDCGTLRRQYPEVSNVVLPDVLADAASLPFAEASLDFVIASHVLEHLPFPLAALADWYAALRPGGVLLLKIPDKRYTFDARRRRTSLHHLVTEHLDPDSFDPRAHFEDWVQYVGNREPGSEALRVETDDLMDQNYSIHYHVWTDEDIQELVHYTQSDMSMKWTELLFLRAHFYRKECAVALRRE
ncbi:MAG: methyltransferase domain-containing protein [Acidobacteriota bacterium]